ncbi:DUF6932 family protein [Dyadobacter sp. CY343]|uniref:DUF6932 family protein n=1 Tax=Dyadobacter sp. CY343 TaxID=2907299 RepID=UPI001F16C45F|nr:hypothetical protein [Dyadobacter sp. CY343]MCE7061650.1 hypothetical protein [Dyadobacter sp. CY343]
MHTLEFDRYGHLMPYELIETDIQTFEQYFLSSQERLKIYAEFKQLIQQLKLEALTEIWIDGSFITLKPNPQDMDVVIFIEAADYERQEILLSTLRQRSKSLDIYFVKSYPPEHPKYFLTNFDKIDWQSFFGRNRQNLKKGIIKLSMS